MGHELEKLFVAPPHWFPDGDMKVLEWVFRNFQNDKTKIILTSTYALYSTPNSSQLNFAQAQGKYLRRCREKKFEVEILAPAPGRSGTQVVLDLIMIHGMKKLVSDRNTDNGLALAFQSNPNYSCKIFILCGSIGELLSTRVFGQDPDDEIIRRRAVEEQLRVMTERAKRSEEENGRLRQENEQLKRGAKKSEEENGRLRQENEQLKRGAKKSEEENGRLRQENEQLKSGAKKSEEEIGRLRQENEQLKQNMALSTSITFQELKEATDNFDQSLKIGTGGQGSVYKGTFRGTTVAIKKLENQNDKDISQFQKEVNMLSTVRHPNLVTLIGICSEPPCLVYEFLSNGSLYNYLRDAGSRMPLSWQVRTRIIGEICLGLVFLHLDKPNPIVHGDLKPDNIFLDENLTCKLSDFGLIKQAANSYLPIDPERTLPYMAPEALKMRNKTVEFDVYSFGVIILELLTGESPYDICETVELSIRAGHFRKKIDASAIKWPYDQALEMARVGIRCADDSKSKRPNLVQDVWPTIKGLVDFANENRAN